MQTPSHLHTGIQLSSEMLYATNTSQAVYSYQHTLVQGMTNFVRIHVPAQKFINQIFFF